MSVVRDDGWERSRGQLDWLLGELGPMPPAERVDSRAVWVAALINPIPALGVAPEVRPAVLAAQTSAERVEVVTQGLRVSIECVYPPLHTHTQTPAAAAREQQDAARASFGKSSSFPLQRTLCLL
jgi:hypothetical protein